MVGLPCRCHVALLLLLVTPPIATAATPEETAAALAKQGIAAYDASDFEAALAKFQEAHATYAGDPVLLYFIARSAEKLGQDATAITYYQRYVANVPQVQESLRKLLGRAGSQAETRRWPWVALGAGAAAAVAGGIVYGFQKPTDCPEGHTYAQGLEGTGCYLDTGAEMRFAAAGHGWQRALPAGLWGLAAVLVGVGAYAVVSGPVAEARSGAGVRWAVGPVSLLSPGMAMLGGEF